MDDAITRWLFGTSHKDVGTLYLLFRGAVGCLRTGLSICLRRELALPGSLAWDGQTYNVRLTAHGVLMVLFVVLPRLVGGLGNWLLPLCVGASEVAFPRINRLSLWLLPRSLGLVLRGRFRETGAGTGWTLYPPLRGLAGHPGIRVDLSLFGFHLAGLSSILGARNLLATRINIRAPGLSLRRLPLFVWAQVVTRILILLVMPVFRGAVTMLLLERTRSFVFFDPARGGDPVLYQHLLWFMGHPEVYVLILPAFGVVSHVLARRCRTPVLGTSAMVAALWTIGFTGLLVWGHHMLTVGLDVDTRAYFTAATLVIAVPSRCKVFNWLATLRGTRVALRTSVLWCVGFVALFTVGGLTGVILANAGLDVALHDTTYVVGHFHYTLSLGSVFGLLARIYHWWPTITGLALSERGGHLHLWLFFRGTNLTFLPMHWLGLRGMPRRIPDYPDAYRGWNIVSTRGSLLSLRSFAVLLGVLLASWIHGEKVGEGDPRWGRTRLTLDAATSSPVTSHTFVSQPPWRVHPHVQRGSVLKTTAWRLYGFVA